MSDQAGESRLQQIEGTLKALLEKIDGAQVEFLSVRRAALATDLSPKRIRQAIRAHELPAVNKGGRRRPLYRIAKADLVRWMQTPPAADPRPAIVPNFRVAKKSTYFRKF